MPSFDYEALDERGQVVTGTTEGESAYAVLQSLRAKGLRVASIHPRAAASVSFRRERKLSTDDLALLTEQLQAITENGLPLAPAVRALAADMHRKQLKQVLEDVGRDLERGATLEEALSKRPECFPPLYINLVRAGEQTGNLPAVLEQLSLYAQRFMNLRFALQEVLIYPLIVLFFAGVIMLGLSFYVIPQFSEIFGAFGKSLPGPTQLVITLSAFIRAYGLLVGALLIVLVVGGVVAVRMAGGSAPGRLLLDRMQLAMPFIGPVYRTSSTGRFSRALGMLLSNGAGIVESLHLAFAATDNAVFERAGRGVVAKVANGEGVAKALAATGQFRKSVCWMLEHGERRGMLDQTLLRLADACEREVTRQDKALLIFLGPVLTVIVGITIGAIVVAMFMPILQLSQIVA